MIEKAEAIVLKSKKYGETSKIVTLYTREFGKLSVIAKGSRSRNNRFGSSLEPLSYISIVFYKYENRELQYITQGSIINHFSKIHNDAIKTMYALPIIELVNNVIHSDEQNEDFFFLLVNTLKSLDDSKENFENHLLYFELHLASQFGFHPNFDNCEICGKEINDEYNAAVFSLERGCLVCNDCNQRTVLMGMKISAESVKSFQKFQNISPEEISNTTLSPFVFNTMYNLITKYLKNHISGMRELKSLEIMMGII
jgi:DNA repair protein RecO (recombination protein O)